MNDNVTYDSMMRVLPSVLKKAPSMLPLAQTAASELKKTSEDSELSGIYYRIEDLPEALLDIMAVDLNVYWYNPNDTLEAKRRTILAAWFVHKHVGTIGGIKRVLDSIRDDASVEEWFQYDGDPFHFRVNLQGTLTEESVRLVANIVNQVKNVRSVLDAIRIHSRMDSGAFVGTITTVHHEIPVTNDIDMDNESSISLYMGVAGMGEIECEDVGTMSRQIEHTLLAAASAGCIICCHNEIRLEVGS